MKNIWIDGIMGVVVGDALGCPVEFLTRNEIAERTNGIVTGMEGWGTFNLPAGSWTDDSSMTLATLDSICRKGCIDLKDIMNGFVWWINNGDYTPFGNPFDIGCTCSEAIREYMIYEDVSTCGKVGEYANGNGSLMRIMPAVLFAYIMKKKHCISDAEAVELIDSVSKLTHNHARAKAACGIYYFLACAILDRDSGAILTDCIQKGMKEARNFYRDESEMKHYACMYDPEVFGNTPSDMIKGTGYVVDTLKTAVWSLIGTDDYAGAVLKCVNIGDDTDTTAAIAGGLAGLYYGFDGIPEDWRNVIQRKDYIEKLCMEANRVTE